MKATDLELMDLSDEDVYYARYVVVSDLLTVRKWNGVKNEVFTRMPLIFEEEGFADFCEENGYLKVYWSNYSQEDDSLDDGEYDINMHIFLEEFSDQVEKAIYQYIEQYHADLFTKK